MKETNPQFKSTMDTLPDIHQSGGGGGGMNQS